MTSMLANIKLQNNRRLEPVKGVNRSERSYLRGALSIAGNTAR